MTYFAKSLLTAVLLLFTLVLTAQVTIGSGLEPSGGTLLDLKEYNDDIAKQGGRTAERGFLLPRVNLTNLHNTDDIKGVTNPKELAGLVVYNPTDTNCVSTGVFLWNGEQWKTMFVDKPVYSLETDRQALVDLYNANPQSQTQLQWDIHLPLDVGYYNNVVLYPENELDKCQNRRVLALAVHTPMLENSIFYIPSSLWTLDELTYLEFDGAYISELSDGIARLTKLEDFRFMNSRLTKLPKGIEQLEKLNSINLSGNYLENVTLPDNILHADTKYLCPQYFPDSDKEDPDNINPAPFTNYACP